jgi:hypothetical protein
VVAVAVDIAAADAEARHAEAFRHVLARVPGVVLRLAGFGDVVPDRQERPARERHLHPTT